METGVAKTNIKPTMKESQSKAFWSGVDFSEFARSMIVRMKSIRIMTPIKTL